MEREVPRGVPRVLPLVGDEEHVGVVEVLPAGVPAKAALRRRGCFGFESDPVSGSSVDIRPADRCEPEARRKFGRQQIIATVTAAGPARPAGKDRRPDALRREREVPDHGVHPFPRLQAQLDFWLLLRQLG